MSSFSDRPFQDTLLNGINSAQALAVTKAFIAKPKEPY
jgi:hypothetical protein